jgi:hypothetical protein
MRIAAVRGDERTNAEETEPRGVVRFLDETRSPRVGGDINEFHIKVASSRACVEGTGL